MGTTLTPMLTVRGGATAIEFYQRAFGARAVAPPVRSPSGQIVAQLAIDGQHFFVVDENPAAYNVSPETLNGTSVRLNLVVDDPDAVAARAVAAGATVVFPIADQPYGMRQGRVADPFGHHWLIGRPSDPSELIRLDPLVVRRISMAPRGGCPWPRDSSRIRLAVLR